MKGKKNSIKLLSILVLIMTMCSLSLFGVACNNGAPENNGPENPVEYTLEMDVSEISLGVGETYQLTYKTNMTGEATWRTTNESVATVSSTGLVTAIGLGKSEIAVIINDKASICKVTVLEKSSFEIKINTPAITLDVNEKFILTAQLTYMGESLNVTPIFSVLNPDIVMVTDGNVTALAFGNTTINVKFEYAGETFETNVSVNVVKSGQIVFEKTLYELEAVDASGNPTEVTLNPSVVIGTQTIENPEIEWITSDETVIDFDNGVVQVKKAGQAFVTAIYEDSDGCKLEGSVRFDIRLAQRQLSAIDLDLTTKNVSISELANISIDKMMINGIDVEFTQSASSFYVENFNESGEFDVLLSNDCYEFTGKITAVSLIKNTEDFKNMLAAAKTASTQEGGFTGYYKLTTNLDFTGVSGVSGNFMQSNNQNSAKGWQATFDGNGYALKNISMSWLTNTGIFGEIGTNGVVKNLSIIGPHYNNTGTFKGYGGIVASNNYGRIENVYVELAFGGNGSGATAPNAGIVANGRTGVITGCLVVDKTASPCTNTGAIVGMLQSSMDLSTNAYVSTAHGSVTNVNGKTLTDAVKVDDVADLFEDANATIKSSLTMLTLNGNDIMWGKVKIVEKVEVTLISSTDDFKNMLAAAKTASTQEGGFTGYYKLTTNLDFTGVTGVAGNFMQTNTQNPSKGWQATFDGDGYALENINMSWVSNSGIFGEIGTNGVIKNLAIINPQYSTSGTFKGYGGIVAHNNFGRIINVYVEVAFGGNGSGATVPNAGIVTNGRTGAVTGCLVVDKSTATYTNTGLIVGMLQNDANLSANAYVSAKHSSVTNVNGKKLTDAVKVDAVADLFAEANATIKSKLTMLKLDGSDIKWGNYKIGTYTA